MHVRILANEILSTNFCSFPDQVCAYHIESTAPLPDVVVGLQDKLRTSPPSNLSCDADGVHLRGQTQPTIGMVYDARVQVLAADVKDAQSAAPSCICSGKLLIPKDASRKSVTVVWTAGTNYDPKKGTAADGYSFKGVDPQPAVLSTVQAASAKTYQEPP